MTITNSDLNELLDAVLADSGGPTDGVWLVWSRSTPRGIRPPPEERGHLRTQRAGDLLSDLPWRHAR